MKEDFQKHDFEQLRPLSLNWYTKKKTVEQLTIKCACTQKCRSSIEMFGIKQGFKTWSLNRDIDLRGASSRADKGTESSHDGFAGSVTGGKFHVWGHEVFDLFNHLVD